MTGPTVYSPYPRRLESLTTCGCNCKTLSDGPAGVQLVRGVFRLILVIVLVALKFYQTLNL